MNRRKLVGFAVCVLVLLSFLASFVIVLVHASPGEWENNMTTGSNGEAIYGSTWWAQTFTTNSTAHSITSVKLYVNKNNSPTENITVSINTASGNLPTGTVLTSGTLNSSTLGIISFAWKEINVSEYNLSPNTQYAIVVSDPDDSSPNWVNWNYATSNPYSDGQACYSSNSGSSWTAYSTYDFAFQVWGNSQSAPSATAILANTTNAGSPVQLSTNLTDPSGVSFYIWSWNNTGSWTNGTTTAFTSNPATFTGTWNSTAGATFSALIYANNTNNKWGTSAVSSFVLNGDVLSVNGTVSAVTMTSSSMAVRYQQKTFTANGRYWIFYEDVLSGTGEAFYTSSTDGINWNTPIAIHALAEKLGENLEVLYNNTIGYADLFIRVMATSILFRRGTPNANGTMTWLTDFQTVASVGASVGNYDFYALMDSNSHLWVSWIIQYGSYTNNTVYLWKNKYTNETWLTDTGFPLVVVQNAVYSNSFMAVLPSGKFCVFYYFSAVGSAGVKDKIWDGSALGSEESVSSDYPYQDYSVGAESYARSVVSDSSGNIYLAFLNQNQNLVFYERSSTWQTEQTIQSSCVNFASPSLILYNNALQVTWINDSYSIAVKSYSGSSWSSDAVQLVGLANAVPTFDDYGTNGRLNGFSQQLGTNAGMLWMENTTTSGSYQIKFGLFVLPDNPPSATNLQINTTLAYQPCLLSATLTDDFGVSGYIFQTNNTGALANSTWASAGNATSYSANYTITALNGTVGNVVNFNVYVNDTSNQWATSAYPFFTITGITVTVTIYAPLNQTYTSGTILVNFTASASSGSISEMWYNVKNGSSWVYVLNQTYTSPTNMTGFIDGASYTFYAWANSTTGNFNGTSTVMFSVSLGASTFTLTVTASSGGNTSPSAGSYQYESGASVSVSETPNAGFTFANWVVNGSADGSSNPYNFDIYGNSTIQAAFSQINFTVTIYLSASGTTSPVSGIYTYAYGSTVSVTASPNSGYSLTNWIVNGSADGSTNPLSFTIYGDTAIQPTYSLVSVIISISSPTNITYTSDIIPVQFAASGGTIDQKWFNCKNGTAWIYMANESYLGGTMYVTGFVNGTSYTFYLFANNTVGTEGYAAVMFSVAIPSASSGPSGPSDGGPSSGGLNVQVNDCSVNVASGGAATCLISVSWNNMGNVTLTSISFLGNGFDWLMQPVLPLTLKSGDTIHVGVSVPFGVADGSYSVQVSCQFTFSGGMQSVVSHVNVQVGAASGLGGFNVQAWTTANLGLVIFISVVVLVGLVCVAVLVRRKRHR